MRISSITIIMKPILISVLKKTNEIEKTLVAKKVMNVNSNRKC